MDSGSSRKSRHKDEFVDLLFSWSLQDIFNEDLYKYQVEKIPDTFETVDHYLGSYVFPLLEETHAELAASLEIAYKAPFAEVTYFQFQKYATESQLYDVQVDFWRNRTSDRGKEPYRTLPGDLVLLTDTKPESCLDFERAGCSYTFGYVRRISEDESEDERGDDSRCSSFEVKTAWSFDGEVRSSKSLYVIYLMSVITHKRIWKALHMRDNLLIIRRVLSKNDSEESCEFCPFNGNTELDSTLSAKLNESQIAAISAATSKVGCSHKASVELVWGPPGTGKTTMLSSLLYILLKMNVRTVVCAPTNTAITELASRVVALVRSSVKSESGESFLSCPLGDLLIFGNNDRLKIGSDTEDIYLDHRVERLLHCFAPITGWRHCVASMIDFLEDGLSQYQIFVENEKVIKSKDRPDDEVQLNGSESFLEFARHRFTHLVLPLRTCIKTLFTHLPTSFYNEKNHKSMVELMPLLDTMELLLFEDVMTSNKLEAIFLFVDTSSLSCIRRQSVSILRSLRTSLNTLGLPNLTDNTKTSEFCFKNASMMFCTISSSYKLHKVDKHKLQKVDKEPFQFLVIDEAAQVKECETAIALQIPNVRHAILVGDERQLPASVSSKLCEEAGFGRSLFERLSSLGHSKHLLNMQYRMHPEISRFPNSNFYLNQILDASNVTSESYERCYLDGRMFGPYSFINISGGREELDDIGHSRRNMVEVAVVVKLVDKLFKAWDSSKGKLSIGLISPYSAQVAAIRVRIQPKYDNVKGFTVKVKSIDGFQGGEEDIIIISTVRSHKGGSIGFLASPQRTNVALTRARHCLWILGNESTLSRSGSVWATLVDDAKDRQCFFNADEDRDIGKTVLNAKKELDQFEDLFSGDSMLFKNSRWQVLFSENFRKSFQSLQPSSIKKLVIMLLLKLASGWRPKKINVDRKCENSSYIVKEFKVDIYYIVCSIDIVKDTIYKQVLKVWDIMPMNETAKLFKRLDNIFSMYTNDFINRCNEKLFERNLEVPKCWSVSSDIIRFKNPNESKSSTGAIASSDCRSYVENSKVSESLLLMKFYSLSIGAVNHLLSDLEGREMDLPFEVTDQEREIIIFPRSSFILGRSGTGKTTILTMKLYQRLHQYCIAVRGSVASDRNVDSSDKDDEDLCVGESVGTTLHQLFVTVSPKLCYAVKNHVSQLKSFSTENCSGNTNFTALDDLDEMSEFRDIPDTFIGIQQEKYPLIITFHKFLMMLDGSLGDSYFKRFHDVRYSVHCDGERSVALQTFLRRKEVTYDRFQSFYWPHFNTKLTKNLDASIVFTEIMSHIKGGLQEGKASDCKRSRQDYISLSESRVSTYNEEKRGVIYDIFEDYEKTKLENGDFDLADFVNDIHLRLMNQDLLGDKMDFVYIDEVQDLSIRQISLFRYICKNVDEGFVFSGDTAQTIARGIDFRFEDIRSLFYNEFLMRSRKCDISGSREKGLLSDMFNLSQNFRTHTGVLRLAQSVIDLICHYFPQSIDSLAPETSLIYGESPIVIEPGSDENLIMSIFGHSGKSGGKWVGFGADQVILVRDDSARKEVSSYIGQQALILTILECKGLEFQDVLLYNFFGSSPLSNQWRLVYEFLKEKDLLDGDSPKSFPSFSQSKHYIMCSELKQLYVAITRTRQRLWICENNVELSKPMLDYWRRLCLVQVRKIDDTLAEAMQRASSPEEWKEQGIKLFWEKNYEMAIMCFEKAGEGIWEKRAKASGLRAAADSLRGSNPEEANIMLREAAEIFDSIDQVESAAKCFCDLGDYERAGRMYLKKSDLRKAAECFCLAGSFKTAAEVYAKGNYVKECLAACTKGKCFDLGLQYVEYWKEQSSFISVVMTPSKEINKIMQEFLEKSAVECHKVNNSTSLMKFVRAFSSTESKRSFLKSLDRLEELMVLEEELGNFLEAAEIAKSLGDILHEINLLEKAKQFDNASLLILSYVLSTCLWVSGNRGWPIKSFPKKVELLNRAVSIAQKVSETFHASICAEVKLLLCEQGNLSDLMLCYNASKQCNNLIGELLCVRKLLDAHLEVNASKYEWDPELYIDPMLFDERTSGNQVSAGTLYYLWNLWKVHSMNILECLDFLERSELIKPEGTVCFCLNYFGIRLSDNFSVTFHLMNPDATWVRNIGKGFMRLNKKVTTLEARHFAVAARNYWHQELVSVGLRILEALQELYKSSMVLPKNCQCVCLLYTFDIAKFFLESKSINVKNSDARKLQNFLQFSTKYFDHVFPLDSRDVLSVNMISLRESDLSKSLLAEIISRNICTSGDLTYGLIGRSVMIILGSSKLKHDIYLRSAKRLSINTSWKPFVECLMRNIKSDSASEFEEGASSDVSNIPPSFSQEAMSWELHRALAETYSIHWRAFDYISPNCFFYLVERLLILVPHSQGYLFTSQSSFVEYLMNVPSDANPRDNLVTDNNSFSPTIFNFIVRVVQECISNGVVTAEWISSSRLDCKVYFPVLILRLFVILCLSCLNSGFSFNVLFDLLRVPHIRLQLPKKFYEALRSRRQSHNPYVALVAGAFKAIGDSLVIVSLSENNHKIACPDAISLDLRSISIRKEIMGNMFPKNTELSPVTAGKNATKSMGNDVSPIVSDQGKTAIMKSLQKTLEMDSDTVSEKGKLQIDWSLFREMLEALKSLTSKNDGDLKSLVLRKKVEVEDHINLLTTALEELTDQRLNSGVDDEFLSSVTSMIEEFNTLSSLFDTSDSNSDVLLVIGEMLESMEARQPILDKLLSLHVTDEDPNGIDISEEIVDHKCSDNSRGTEDRRTYVAATNQDGKGKNKKSKKSRGKGRRRK